MKHSDFAEAKRFIFTDIEREIALAYASQHEAQRAALKKLGVQPGGGNFLAAMGLLSYTEFAGKLKYNMKRNDGRDWASENFNRFFDDLGIRYKQVRTSGIDVYGIFRCGLVHEYYAKENCTIHMCRKSDNRIGIGQDPDGKYYFVVETYFGDFKHAFNALEKALYNMVT